MKMRRGCVPLYLALLTITVLLFLSPTIAWRPWPHNKTKVQLDSIYGDSKKFESSSKFVHLKYHIGPVLTANITVHAIWYGAWQHNQKKIIREFINSISIVNSWHTSVLDVSNQSWGTRFHKCGWGTLRSSVQACVHTRSPYQIISRGLSRKSQPMVT